MRSAKLAISTQEHHRSQPYLQLPIIANQLI